MADNTQTRTDEPTPSGGAYSIAYWKDAAGGSTQREKAVAVEVVEFDAKNREIKRTYAQLE